MRNLTIHQLITMALQFIKYFVLNSQFQVAACGVFAYATFSIIAGCLGDYRKPPNLVVMVTGIISIVQVPIFAHLLWSVIQFAFLGHPSAPLHPRRSKVQDSQCRSMFHSITTNLYTLNLHPAGQFNLFHPPYYFHGRYPVPSN